MASGPRRRSTVAWSIAAAGSLGPPGQPIAAKPAAAWRMCCNALSRSPLSCSADPRFNSSTSVYWLRAPQRCSERSEEHTSELQSLMRISYAVFCLKKKNKHIIHNHTKTKLDTDTITKVNKYQPQ